MVQKLSVDQALSKAKLHLRNGEPEQARSLYLAVIGAFPDNSRARHALARLKPGRIEAAGQQPPTTTISCLTGLYKSGDFQRVIDEAEILSTRYPGSFDIWNLAAVSFAALKQFEDAEYHFRAAISANAKRSDAHFHLGIALKEQGKLVEAAESYRHAIELKPDYADACNNLGMTLKDLGQLDEAAGYLADALRHKPDSAEIYYNLSLLKRFSAEDEAIAKMHQLYQSDRLSEDGKSFICFALYKAHEDIGNVEDAYRFLAEGNSIVRRLLGYQFARDQKFFDDLKRLPARIFPAPVKRQNAQTVPIFILGMPRSGTTLVEQIISSHSQVYGAGELEDLNRLINPLLKQGGLFDQKILDGIRRDYLARIDRIGGGLPYVTDKMPHNFRWISIIAAAFPEARIVHVKRDPRAVCWSNYKHYFKQKGLGYTYDLGDTISYYRLYEDLMRTFEQQIPGRIYPLDYEKLTTDPDVEIRNLVDFLDIGWEDACLSFENNTRSVKTASTVQVRKKIYQGSSEEWRKYERFVEMSFEHLEDIQK